MNSLTPSGEDAARAAEARDNGPKDGPKPTRNCRETKSEDNVAIGTRATRRNNGERPEVQTEA